METSALTLQRCGSCKLEKPVEDFSPSYRGTLGTWCRACFAADKRGDRQATANPTRTCGHCGGTYVPRILKASAAYCSRACKERARKADLKAARLAAKATRSCVSCGAVIGPERRADARFCSETCNTVAHRGNKNLHRRQTGVTFADLGERDGWTCGICRGPVDRTLAKTDPMGPSIDHITPLSEGGTDDWSNLRLTHRDCNTSRRPAA